MTKCNLGYPFSHHVWSCIYPTVLSTPQLWSIVIFQQLTDKVQGTGLTIKTLQVIARPYHITLNSENQSSDNMLCSF